MPRISNQDIYPPDQNVQEVDFLIGTDGDVNANKRTKTFPVNAIAQYVADYIGQTVPGISQNNIGDIVRVKFGTTGTLDEIVAAINALPSFEINEFQDIHFIAVQVDVNNIPVKTFTLRLVKVGKGVYGTGGIAIGLSNLQIINVSAVSADDVTFSDTVREDLGTFDAPATILSVLNELQTPFEVNAVADNLTIFRVVIDGVRSEWLWISDAATVGAGQTEVTLSDLQILESTSGIAVLSGQDNVAIVMSIVTEDDEAATAVAAINQLAPFVISETQMMWFNVKSQITSEQLDDADNPVQVVSIVTNLYKLINKGKGVYGAGETQIAVEDLLSMRTSSPSVSDVENDPSTDTFTIATLGDLSLSEYINTANPPYEFQSQLDGYTLIQITDTDLSYLYTGEAGTFGEGEGQTTLFSFQLLTEGNQDLQTTLVQGNMTDKTIVYVQGGYAVDAKRGTFRGRYFMVVGTSLGAGFVFGGGGENAGAQSSAGFYTGHSGFRDLGIRTNGQLFYNAFTKTTFAGREIPDAQAVLAMIAAAGGGGAFVPLSGTEVGSPVTGDLEFKSDDFGYRRIFSGSAELYFNNDEAYAGLKNVGDGYSCGISLEEGSVALNASGGDDFGGIVINPYEASFSTNSATSKGIIGQQDYTPNYAGGDRRRIFAQVGYVDDAIAAADNSTTTALSLSDLNTAYPDALTGFRVRCLDISGGGLIYEKTTSGWCSYAANTVV